MRERAPAGRSTVARSDGGRLCGLDRGERGAEGRLVKAKNIIALLLVLSGTNLFTYTTARYRTTREVLQRARERVATVLENQRRDEQRSGQIPERQIQLAVKNAGGLYGGWNQDVTYWGAGCVLAISGVLVTFYEPRKAAG